MVLKMKLNRVLVNGQLLPYNPNFGVILLNPTDKRNTIFVFSQKWPTNKNVLPISSYGILLQNNEFNILSNLFPHGFYISFWRKKLISVYAPQFLIEYWHNYPQIMLFVHI